jgi:hypothetical protein
MALHRIFDVVVLITTLLGGAAAAVLMLSSLFLDNESDGVSRGRRLLLSIIALGIVFLLLEWLVIH